MESTLFGLFILVATYQFALFWREGGVTPALAGALALLLATLTRPEGMLIAGLILGLSLAVALFQARERLAPLALSTVAFASAFGLYFAWRYSRYGYVLPNTFYAKTGGGVAQVLRGGLLAYLFLMQFAVPLAPAALVVVWETGAPPLSRLHTISVVEWFRRSSFIVFAAVIFVAYTANNVLVGGDYMAMHRFFVPVLPFMYLLFGLLVAALSNASPDRQMPLDSGRSWPLWRWPRFSVHAAGTFFFCLASAAAWRLPRRADRALACRPAVRHRQVFQRVQAGSHRAACDNGNRCDRLLRGHAD